MKPGVVQPRSRKDIRLLAKSIRYQTGYYDKPYFPIVRFVELVLPTLRPGFIFDVVSKEEMGNNHGLTIPEQNLIQIREDVYDRACKGEGRDRLTIAHELGHYLMHSPENVVFTRSDTNGTTSIYCQAEWQADAFGGELLVPAHLMRGRTPQEIASVCGVSLSAARCQASKI